MNLKTMALTGAMLTAGVSPSCPPGLAAPPETTPADKVQVGGRDVLEILDLLGAKREAGGSDGQLAAYLTHFNRIDTNQDGTHSKQEFIDHGTYMTPEARRGIFRAADNNGDGQVSRVEYVLNRIITDEAKSIVQKTDADRDGRVAKTEFVSGSPLKDKSLAGAVFDALDANGDGAITIPEYLRVWGVWARPDFRAQEALLAARLEKRDGPAGLERSDTTPPGSLRNGGTP